MPRRLAGLALLLLLVVATLGAAGPARGQETADLVRIPFPQDDGTLTPYTFQVGYPLMTLVYDTVMWRDADGVPRPWLARSVERSADSRELTIHLRPGIRWQDGKPLTASDVEFTFDFVASHPHPRFSPQLFDIASVRAVDDATVVIDLKRPSLGFEDQPLADLPILPRHIWEGLSPDQDAPSGLPMGSGPYRLVDHTPGKSYTFVANPNYFGGRPLVRRIEVPVMRTTDETFRALQQSRVDMLPASLDSQEASAAQGLGLRVAKGDSYLGTVLMFNLQRPPFNRLAARRAASRALDLDRIAGSLAGLGETSPASAQEGYIHPASPWASGDDLHDFDPDTARIGFAEANVTPFRLLAPSNDPVRSEIARQVAAELESAGASVKLVELPSEKLARAVGQDSSSSPSFQAAIWSAPPLASYDPNFLEAVFGNPFVSPLNYSYYRSPRFQALAAEAADATNEDERHRAVTEELGQLARDMPVVPLVFPEGAFAYRPQAYDGWVYIKGSGILDKRSFLPGEAEAQPGGTPIGSPLDTSGDSGGIPWWVFVLLAVGFVGVAMLVRNRLENSRR
jgi:peptide/nickel transport system substrate-binding protein